MISVLSETALSERFFIPQNLSPCAYELRLQTDDAYRVFYIAKFQEAAYVLHAFQKKTQKTSKHDLVLGQQRYEAAQRAHRFQQAKAKHPSRTRE